MSDVTLPAPPPVADSAAPTPGPHGREEDVLEHVRAFRAGPGSVAWKINQEVVLLLGWPAAVFLQVAHPLVAEAVLEHSAFMRDASSRFARLLGTIRSMQALTFGDEDAIMRTAAKINGIHDRVHGALPAAAGGFPAGHRYSAHDPALLLWVHVTLLRVLPRTYELLVGPLTTAERDGYCREALGLGPLLGMSMHSMPSNVAEVDAYLSAMVQRGPVHVSPAAHRIVNEALGMRGASQAVIDHVFGRPPAPLAPWLYAAGAPLLWLPVLLARCLMSELLPPAVSDAYGFPRSRAQRVLAAATAWLVRASLRLFPARLRYWPEARRAARLRSWRGRC